MKNNIGINNRGVYYITFRSSQRTHTKKKLLKRMGSKGETKSGEKEIKLCGYLSTRYKLINFDFFVCVVVHIGAGLLLFFIHLVEF